MTTPASAIITRARIQLQDMGPTYRWTDAELLLWIGDAQRALVAVVADAGSAVVTIPLIAGSRQLIPDSAYTLLNIYRNLNAAGLGGTSTRLVRRELIDDQDPNWASRPASPVVQNYVYDPQDKRAFYVSPPNDGTGFVEANVALMPIDPATDAALLQVQDIYQTPITDYVLGMAHLKESDYAGGQQVSQMYLQKFQAFLTANQANLGGEQPNVSLTPFNTQVKGSAK
jgi:hypothetical protein